MKNIDILLTLNASFLYFLFFFQMIMRYCGVIFLVKNLNLITVETNIVFYFLQVYAITA